MMKCKWVGDTNDEVCETCDGCKVEIDGEIMDAPECAGYEPSDEEVLVEDEGQEEEVEEKPAKKKPLAKKSTSKTAKKAIKAEISEEDEETDEDVEEEDKPVKKAKLNGKKKAVTKKSKAEVIDSPKKAKKVEEEPVGLEDYIPEERASSLENIEELGAKTNKIIVESSGTISLGNGNFYKFNINQEVDVKDVKDQNVNIPKIWESVFSDINAEIDRQIEAVMN